MAKYGLIFGSIGFLYSGTECSLEKIREKKDFINGAFGGLCGGTVIGLAKQSLSTGVGAGIAMAFVSATVDATGYTLSGSGMDQSDIGVPKKPSYSPTMRNI